jgi:hypothetical protein
MSSNNPFASAMADTDPYAQHRDPPPPPATHARLRNNTPPSRPPKGPAAAVPAPPSYDEVAGREAAAAAYPREKSESSSSSRPRRSRSESDHKHLASGSRRHGHRDRGDRPHRSEKEHRLRKSPSKKTTTPVKSKNLDTIDKLDVTGFFGGGFHHDGPFDACTPHRNKNVKAAPVMAFPADGPNNLIKGYGSKDKHLHMDAAFGTYDDEQNEIIGRRSGANDVPLIKTNHPNSSDPAALYMPKHNPSVINFDAKQKAIPVHGELTAGLGTSTFVDGAPAPRGDEYLSPHGANGGGLGRKKSIVDRLRKNSASESNSRRASHDAQDEVYEEKEESTGSLLLRRVKSLKVGRR